MGTPTTLGGECAAPWDSSGGVVRVGVPWLQQQPQQQQQQQQQLPRLPHAMADGKAFVFISRLVYQLGVIKSATVQACRSALPAGGFSASGTASSSTARCTAARSWVGVRCLPRFLLSGWCGHTRAQLCGGAYGAGGGRRSAPWHLPQLFHPERRNTGGEEPRRQLRPRPLQRRRGNRGPGASSPEALADDCAGLQDLVIFGAV